ncbi:udp-glucose:sterol glycosyltransferase [Moniliophthora roreri MCA 2997]|uniref:Sterol 3-beta-glucosyltransferase n=1 Tax=Moniliophthora roreri (strain MCA 2997) TaxID=1381753 RepID=V2Y0B2_MONRO|nr:udp-glucose:sterol glycosyltransferase [Moniliophthora roreri MCA 2997]
MANKLPSLQPLTHDPAVAPTIDTSPESLGYLETGVSNSADSSPTASRVKRFSSAVEKLGRSLSGKASPTSPPSGAGHRRLFSINRKGKGKAEDGLSASAPSISRPLSPMGSQPRKSQDDSPFITPPSPTLPASRPSLSAFRGGGSMRAGTQTLIQALQALPWTADPDNDDEVLDHGLPHISDEDGSEDEGQTKKPLASSIHTIHRPVARSMRMSASGRSRVRLNLPNLSPSSDDESPPDIPQSDEDVEDIPDFEERTPRPPDADRVPGLPQKSPQIPGTMPDRIYMSRSGSMATVRLQRRTKLAEKLREVFELEGIDEVRAEMPCWLLRSVLLQGYMYLTNSYLCFFAHMPTKEDQILKSGSLNKKAQRTKRWIKHWFVLKNDALSWYQSSSDPYFPHGIVDLRYAISCEPVGERGFRLRTNQRSVYLSADSVPSREEWVKAIRKVIFKAQNMGDSVKIAIPYSAILDVDKSDAMDFSETIEVKVYDKEASDHFSVDSYFFAYFHDISGALEQIRDAVRAQRTFPGGERAHTVLDTTASRPQAAASEKPSMPSSSSSLFRITSLLRPFSEPRSSNTVTTSSSAAGGAEDFTHISRRPDSSSFVPVTTSGAHTPPKGDPQKHTQQSSSDLLTPTPSNVGVDHTTTSAYTLSSLPSSSSSWTVGVPAWLKASKPRVLSFGSNTSEAVQVAPPGGKVREMYSSTSGSTGTSSRWSGVGDLAYSVLENPGNPVDDDAVERFRAAFAYDEKETLLGYFPGYIFRLLPVYGRLYISTNYFCFKSTGPLAARTRMTLPIRDILSVELSKATRFGHHGLIIIVKGHEELFFEFGAEDKRDAFVALLERQMEDVRRRIASGEAPLPTQGQRDALILEEFEPKPASQSEITEPPMPESMSDSLPAVMFTSASSTFLTFKPQKSLHFTFLTIGSRGDVQPYIALAKGLMADGHRVRIATHGEFKEWIESYGIEFGYVGGDPAELMRICVENGTFTVAFLKEGLLKFRGWLDDLLKTSWEACQGTDVLVESPSAMGGYHIAEALAIPYFRAFTMTWTRTRAYPHAFAVPERKMGGSYNYMSYVMFDQVFWRAISGQINRWRRNVLHISSTSLDRMEPHKIPFLYNFSPHVVPPPLDWPEWIRVTGYWFLDSADVSAKKWTPPEDLVKFLDTARSENKKVVYIGFGSIVVSDPKTMTRCVIDAIVQSGVYAILSKGWSDRLHVKASEASEPEEPLPKQIYSISSIPHDWLFQRIDAACHHGGAGTTGASLRAGIPTIIKPFFGDQFFWADRVEALGVGSGVRKLSVESLAEALITATTDVKQIDRARLLGEQIRAENGVATAIESIYRDLEYARSLIKHNVSESEDDDSIDNEHGTVRDHDFSNSELRSGDSSSGSARGAPSEDWSVISDQDERRSSVSSRHSEGRRPSADRGKRTSLAAAMLSVLPDSLNPGSPRRRTVSTGSKA